MEGKEVNVKLYPLGVILLVVSVIEASRLFLINSAASFKQGIGNRT